MSYWYKYRVHLLTLAVFTYITYFYFPSLFSGFFTTIESNDGRLLAYSVCWDIHKLLTDPFHIFQATIFFPHKNTLVYSEHVIGTSILGIPVWLLTGGNPAATFNFLMISGYVLNAWFTFLLIRKLVHRNMIAFLGAFINGYCSYRLLNFAHLQNAIVFYIPLCLLFFYNYLENKKGKYLIGIFLCLFMQSMSSWYHMVFILLMFFLFTGYYYFFEKKLSIADLKKITGIFLLTFLLLLPFALPYLKFNKEVNSAYSMSEIISADFGGYFIPSPYTYGNQFFYNYWGITKSRWSENFNFIGYSVLLFSFLGIFEWYRDEENTTRIRFRKDRSVFLWTAIVFFIFSLGPYLFINDHQTHIKLPYFFIFKLLPPIRFLRGVARYSTVVFLMMAVLASYGLAAFRITNPWHQRIMYLVVFSLLVVEFAPQPRYDRFSDMSKTPEVYQRIKNDPSIEAIVELPIDVGPFTTTKYEYYGAIHLKPMLNGYSGYEPPTYSLYKNLFKTPINQFSCSVLLKLGITDLLCNPEYKEPVDTAYASLTMEKDGYRLYKIKPQYAKAVFFENMGKYPQLIQLTDSSLHITKEMKGTEIYPGNQLIQVGYICPKAINQLSSITYTSNKPLDELNIQFRAYAPGDTLRIKCIGTSVNGADSTVKVYTYTASNEYNEKYLSLPCYKSGKIAFEMYSTQFTDRAFIRNLSLVIK